MCRWRFFLETDLRPLERTVSTLVCTKTWFPLSSQPSEERRRRRRGSKKGLLYKCIYATCTCRETRKKGDSSFCEASHSSNLRTTCSGALWATRRDRLLKEALWFRLLPGMLPVRTNCSHDSLDRISFRLRRLSILSFHSLPSWWIINNAHSSWWLGLLALKLWAHIQTIHSRALGLRRKHEAPMTWKSGKVFCSDLHDAWFGWRASHRLVEVYRLRGMLDSFEALQWWNTMECSGGTDPLASYSILLHSTNVHSNFTLLVKLAIPLVSSIITKLSNFLCGRDTTNSGFELKLSILILVT